MLSLVIISFLLGSSVADITTQDTTTAKPMIIFCDAQAFKEAAVCAFTVFKINVPIDRYEDQLVQVPGGGVKEVMQAICRNRDPIYAGLETCLKELTKECRPQFITMANKIFNVDKIDPVYDIVCNKSILEPYERSIPCLQENKKAIADCGTQQSAHKSLQAHTYTTDQPTIEAMEAVACDAISDAWSLENCRLKIVKSKCGDEPAQTLGALYSAMRDLTSPRCGVAGLMPSLFLLLLAMFASC